MLLDWQMIKCFLDVKDCVEFATEWGLFRRKFSFISYSMDSSNCFWNYRNFLKL